MFIFYRLSNRDEQKSTVAKRSWWWSRKTDFLGHVIFGLSRGFRSPKSFLFQIFEWKGTVAKCIHNTYHKVSPIDAFGKAREIGYNLVIFWVSKRLQKLKVILFPSSFQLWGAKKAQLPKVLGGRPKTQIPYMFLRNNTTNSHNSVIFSFKTQSSIFHPLSNCVKEKKHSCQIVPVTGKSP